MSTRDCALCRRVAETGDQWIADFAMTRAYLHEDQFFPGYCLLILKRHATELFHLDPDERATMIEEVSRLARALDTVFRPVKKVNYELLGNQVPHIHWHVIPRLAGDPLPGGPVWLVEHEPVHLPDVACRERVAAIRAAL